MMGWASIYFNFAIFLALALAYCDGAKYTIKTPKAEQPATNFKLRLPNELEMGFAESPKKIEETEEDYYRKLDANKDIETKQYQHRNIHMDMSTPQLQFHFGVSHPDEVDKENYQIIKIVPIVVPSSMWKKRKGADKQKRGPDEDSAHFAMDVFQRKIRIPVRRNDKMLKGSFKVVTVGQNGTRVEMKPKRSHRMTTAETNDLVDPFESEFRPEFQEICSQYRHASEDFVGAITQCNDDGTRGFVADIGEGATYEVHPLGEEFANVFDNWECKHCRNGSRAADKNTNTRLHHGYHLVVRRSLEDAQNVFEDDNEGKKRSVVRKLMKRSPLGPIKTKEKRSGSKANKIVEIGIFVDDRAYRTYSDYFNQGSTKATKKKIVFLILALMNGVQAVYHYPNLRESVDFRIVYLEIQERQEIYHTGEQGKAYEAFCSYQLNVMKDKLNAMEDSNPNHWDTSLLVSGWNFYGYTADRRKSYATMGLAAVEGMCYQTQTCRGGKCNGPYNCVIGEMGVKDFQGKPYPSCGFTAVFVMAHEIGHNLGMSHDGKRSGKGANSCSKQGFIMSPSRGTNGETLWSQCSADVLSRLNMPCLEEGDDTQSNAPGLDHNMFGSLPGLIYTPNQQCQIYTQDNNARLYIKNGNLDQPNDEICQGLRCKVTDGNSGYYTAGPGLEGTVCGKNHYCIKSECVYLSESDIKRIMSDARQNQNNVESLPPPPKEEVGLDKATWSEWYSWSSCKSGCILGAKGARNRYRKCNIPRHLKDLRSSNCPGSAFEVDICTHECPAVKLAKSFAENECQKYRSSKKRLYQELTGLGKQPSHSSKYPEQSCTVYCQLQKSSKEYYSPHVEIAGMKNIQTFFPDGTRCHQDKQRGIDYYCRKGICGREGSRQSRAELGAVEIPVEQSANPSDGIGDPNADEGIGESKPPEFIEKYFTLDENDKKLGEKLDGAAPKVEQFDVDEELIPEMP